MLRKPVTDWVTWGIRAGEQSWPNLFRGRWLKGLSWYS